MADDEQKLVRTSDEILDDLRELRRLEEEKRTVPVGSGRFRELADAIVRKSRQMMRRVDIQDDLSAEIETDKRSIDGLANDEPKTKETK